MAARSWFAVREVAPGVHLISEPVHVNCYLVLGTERAVLIDTGLGIEAIRAVVESMTDLDVMVVNSHYHFDHSGGNKSFDHIAIHRDGAESLAKQVPDIVFEEYAEYAQDMLERFSVYRELDERFFHLLTDETTPRPVPPGVDLRSWRTVPSVATRLLEDGDVIDLGGRSLQVLHTPGHTPDCISLLDEANGLLFGGDTINTGPIYAQFSDSDPLAFAASTRRLANLRDTVRTVFCAHFLRYAADRAFLVEVADGFQALVDGAVQLHPNVDCVGTPVNEARFARFSIFVADQRAGSAPL